MRLRESLREAVQIRHMRKACRKILSTQAQVFGVSMRASPSHRQNDIDVSMLPSIIRRSALGLLAASAFVGGLTYAGLQLVPSHFTSQAQIRIGGGALGDGGRNNAGNPEQAALRVDREAIASRVHELRSPDLARKLATELRLNTRPEFNSILDNQGLASSAMRLFGLGKPRPGETEEERVLGAYYRALEVYQLKDTRVITLGFTARDGELAAAAANRLIELYQDWLRQQGVTETTDANAWLAPEIEKRTRELSVAEAEVERFRSTANLFRGGGGQPSGLAEQQLTDILGELTKARAQRGEAQSRATAARELMVRGAPDAIPEVQKSPVIQGLIAQRVRVERDLAEAATQLLPAHPRMKQLNANVADVRRQIQREASTIVDGLEREVKALGLREELATRTLDEAKARVGNKAGDRVRLAELEDDVKAKRRELEVLRDRFEASRSRGTTKAVPVEVQVIATALPSSRPAWPHRAQISALAAAATFVLGLVLVLFREILAGGGRQQARSRGDHGAGEQAPLGRPFSAAGPSIAVGASAGSDMPNAQRSPVPASANSVAAARPDDLFRSEAARDDAAAAQLHSVASVVERLIGNSAGQSGYRALIVGAGPDVDVREEAADIAAGLSAQGRQVVLVDWSLDGRGIASGLGLPQSPGFAELLAGTASFDDVIRMLPDGDVHVLPCGAAGVMTEASLDPNRLNLLLDALDEAYGDVVITGEHDAIRALFQVIEGRVDAGVIVESARSNAAIGDQASHQFLGFDVTEIDILRFERQQAGAANRRNGRRPERMAGRSALTAH